MKEKTKMPMAFGKKMAIGVAAGAVVIALLLILLWVTLANYQTTAPEEIALQVRNAYIEADANTIAQYWTNLPQALQDTVALQAYLQENTADKAVKMQAMPQADGSISYDYSIDGASFAQLNMRPSAAKGVFGLPMYESAELVQQAQTVYTVMAPAAAQLVLNGAPMPENYLTEQKPVVVLPNGDMLDGQAMNLYTIDDFTTISTLEATMEDATGTAVPCTVQADETGTQYTVTCTPAAEVAQTVYDAALPIVEDYVDYSMRLNASDEDLLARVLADTTLYQMISDYNTDNGEKITSGDYQNVVTDNAVFYGGDLYACHVTLQYVIQNDIKEKKSFDFSATVYLVQRADSENPEEDVWYMAALESA